MLQERQWLFYCLQAGNKASALRGTQSAGISFWDQIQSSTHASHVPQSHWLLLCGRSECPGTRLDDAQSLGQNSVFRPGHGTCVDLAGLEFWVPQSEVLKGHELPGIKLWPLAGNVSAPSLGALSNPSLLAFR